MGKGKDKGMGKVKGKGNGKGKGREWEREATGDNGRQRETTGGKAPILDRRDQTLGVLITPLRQTTLNSK